MASKCILGYHGACSACEHVVTPNEPHSHQFSVHERGKPDLLCGACIDTIICAALPVLEALEAAEVEPSGPAISRLRRSNALLIAVGARLPGI